jgi:hypothetical protein
MSKLSDYRNATNEGGAGYNPHEAADMAQARAASEARLQSLMPRFVELRTTWNAAVAKYSVNGQLSTNSLAKIERECGVTKLEMTELRARRQ